MNDNNDEKEKEQIKKASNRRNHNCYSGWRKKRGEPYNNNNQLVVSWATNMENYADDNSKSIIELTIDIESIIVGAGWARLFSKKLTEYIWCGYFFLSVFFH